MDRDKEGPRLGGVYGRTAGSLDSFQYSDALKNSKIKWSEDTLNKWLTDTEKLVPNNDMTFHVEKANERSEIIAYLKQNSTGAVSPTTVAARSATWPATYWAIERNHTHIYGTRNR